MLFLKNSMLVPDFAQTLSAKEISSRIRNPEILSLVPVLLQALNDPTQWTRRALSDLMRKWRDSNRYDPRKGMA